MSRSVHACESFCSRALDSSTSNNAGNSDCVTLGYEADGGAEYARHLVDVDSDGHLDLTSHYMAFETGIACGVYAGEPAGVDRVKPVGCRGIIEEQEPESFGGTGRAIRVR